VSGGSYLSSTYQIPCPPNYPNPKKCVRHPEHAFLYGNGHLNDLGTLNGGKNSQGNSINLSGQVAGWSATSSGNDAVLWNGKKTVDLGALAPIAGQDSVAFGINDSGQVVGTWGTNNPEGAFLYSNGTITTLPAPSFVGSFGCQARALNNNGQIAGVCWDASDNAHLVLWSGDSVSDLAILAPGTIAIPEALSINNSGQIVGYVGGGDGFLYSNGTLKDLGSFNAESINDTGVIVGGPSIDNAGTVQNLDNMIPSGTPYVIQDATAINTNGQIVANANDTATGQTHALLLTPSG
jgi:probable HAF family extracellular repeat protein